MCDVPTTTEMSEIIRCRQRSIQELIEFTESCQKKLSGIFEALGWSQELKNLQEEPMVVCPYNHNHRVPRGSLERHASSCKLTQMGYSTEEQKEMYDATVFYEKFDIPTITLDKHTQQEVILQAKANGPAGRTEGTSCQSEYSAEPSEVPLNHKRAICDLTVADRLALYDHVILTANQQKGQKQSANNDDLYVDLAAKLKKDEEQNGPKSHLEVLAEMRDYKRRRQSYRAKNVHITKKSYTEVIREVIEVHSGELARVWQQEMQEESKASKQHSQRRRSKEQRSGSAESARDRHGSRHRHQRGGDRQRSREREHKRERARERRHSREREGRRRRESRSPDEREHGKKSRK